MKSQTFHSCVPQSCLCNQCNALSYRCTHQHACCTGIPGIQETYTFPSDNGHTSVQQRCQQYSCTGQLQCHITCHVIPVHHNHMLFKNRNCTELLAVSHYYGIKVKIMMKQVNLIMMVIKAQRSTWLGHTWPWRPWDLNPNETKTTNLRIR